MRYKIILFIICLLMIMTAMSCLQKNPKVVESLSRPRTITSTRYIENFRLLDHEGKSHELYYYSDMKAVVLISQGNGCPIVRQSIPTIRKLKDKYESKGVAFFMINANPQDNRHSIAQEARDYDINIPILEDRAQIIAMSLNIQRTAEAILINPANWTVVYRGAIDDRLGYESQKEMAEHHYLSDAIEQLLEGSPIEVPRSMVKGCLISFEQKMNSKRYTYTEDVAPILERKCLKCHSPRGVAPWSMDDYDTVKGWGNMIREVIRTKRMPPWKPDHYYGKFKDDISLTPEEVKAIVFWVEEGMLRGNGGDL